MRGRNGIFLTVALAGAAHAQLRLPSQLPTLPRALTQGVAQTGSDALQQLSDLRHLEIARLIRANPAALATDPHGNLIIRDELLAYSPTDQALDAARTRGFAVLREQSSGELGLRLVVLKPPPMKTPQALRLLRDADPGGVYDYNHVYTGSGRVATSAPAAARAAAEPSAAAQVETKSLPRVGLVDAGIDAQHTAFRDAVIHPWGCEGKVRASAHGTAVASLLIGRADKFHGAIPDAELYAADVYCNSPTGGAVDALTAAFAWLAQQRVAVINVSLVGPDNAALAALVRAMLARGHVLVAAVGNDGPAAPPLYPASYPGVVGVTGVDAHRRALIEAARGNQVMFAAPGADMAAADLGGKYSRVRGTSFAAPLVAGLLARDLSAPDASAGRAAIEALTRRALDLGSPGRDLTYGFGLVGEELRNDPAAVITR